VLVCAYGQLTPLGQEVFNSFFATPTSFSNCSFYVANRNGYDYTFGFRFFNDDQLRVKQAQLTSYTSPNGSDTTATINWFGSGGTPETVLFKKDYYSYNVVIIGHFLLADDTRVCVGFDFREDCPNPTQMFCPQTNLNVPTSCLVNGGPSTDISKCVVGSESASEWLCVNGDCLRKSCNLNVRSFVPARVESNGAVQLGFRLTDCANSMVGSLTSEQLSVFEQNSKLSPVDTKQQLQRITGQKNYIQLMVAMCPRTVPILDDLLTALHLFKQHVNFTSSYVALTVFDGARGYVDIARFTNSYSTISRAIDSLRNYTMRDDSCNLYQSANAKMQQLSSYRFGQLWDLTHFVLFTSSTDLVNFDSDFSVGFNTREISMHLIAIDFPPVAQYSAVATLFNYQIITKDANAIIGAFVNTARRTSISVSSDYMFGYCSPSRQGSISARLDWTPPASEWSSTLYKLNYGASSFGSCQVNMDYCAQCTNNLDSRYIICPKCFTTPTWSGKLTTNVQTLLRCPNEGGNDCSLEVVNATGSFNVYVRKDGLSNPLFYDTKFTGVSQSGMPIYLPFISSNDLVGVYVELTDVNGNDAKITLVSTAATPDSAPLEAPYTDAPYSWTDPNAPIASPSDMTPDGNPSNSPSASAPNGNPSNGPINNTPIASVTSASSKLTTAVTCVTAFAVLIWA
jgi:hypothetical protein